MARISNARTIRVDDETLNDVKELGEKFGLTVPLVVANAVRIMKVKCAEDKSFTLLPRAGRGSKK